MNKLKIEKNISIPAARQKYDLSNFEVKDSVWVKTRRERDTLRSVFVHRKMKIITRATEDGYRIWRVK